MTIWLKALLIASTASMLLAAQLADKKSLTLEIAKQIAAAAQKAAAANTWTKALEDAVAGGRNAILRLPGAIPIEGGLPIIVDGKVIGAIGVSGGTSPQDGECAKAGIDALAKILGK